MGAKVKRRPMSNEEAVLKLEAAGYDMDQFRMDTTAGYYVPLQLWSKYVGKFNPGMKRGWRVELNTESSRQVGRRFNMEEINEMTASLGIGNGNTYKLDPDDRLDCLIRHRWYGISKRSINEYEQPIKVGKQFITNIIQSHRRYNAITNKQPNKRFIRYEARNEAAEKVLDDCNRSGNYKKAEITWGCHASLISPSDFQEVITLGPDGVLKGIKQPYGTITGIYVHFFPTWKTKREARYHVTFDHGARVVITNDWITRSFATTYPEDFIMRQCDHSEHYKNPPCDTCIDGKVHEERWACHLDCQTFPESKCNVLMDYSSQNMWIVHRGDSFKIPQPAKEPTTYESPEERLARENERDWFIVNAVKPANERGFHNLIDCIVNYAGGRI